MSSDMDEDKETTVRSIPRPNATWNELVAAARQEFEWKTETELFAYIETATECTLKKCRLSEIDPGGLPLEGRLFDDRGELRWVADEHGRFNGWLVDEKEGGPVLVRQQNYYLIGRGVATGSNEFEEARYPRKTFTYPVTVTSDNAAAVRAFIGVKEYFRIVNDDEWQRFSDDIAVQALNEPMLIEHRFVSVGVSP